MSAVTDLLYYRLKQAPLAAITISDFDGNGTLSFSGSDLFAAMIPVSVSPSTPIADTWTWPVTGDYKQRDHAPIDSEATGEYVRVNWIGHPYNLLGKIASIHEGDDVILLGANCYGDPVFSISNGIVTFAEDVGAPAKPGARATSTWRKYVVIEYTLPDGSIVEAKYAHLSKMLVKAGDHVTTGQQIGAIGDADGAFAGAAHLHFAICVTSLLLTSPKDWPSTGHTASQAQSIIATNYTDPLFYLRARIAPVPFVAHDVVVNTDGDELRVRSGPGTAYTILRMLRNGTVVRVVEESKGWFRLDSATPEWISAAYTKPA